MLLRSAFVASVAATIFAVAATAAVPAETTSPATPAQTQTRLSVLQVAGLAIAQALDSSSTARVVDSGGRELNPFVRPFVHGGFPEIYGAQLLGDVVRFRVLRHQSSRLITADTLQMSMNLYGYLHNTWQHFPSRPSPRIQITFH